MNKSIDYISLKPKQSTALIKPVRTNNMTVRPVTGKKSATTAKKPKYINAKNKPNTASTRTGRTAQRTDTGQGPGTYDVRGKGFGEDTKGFTIGVKREKSIEHSPGPGSYDESKSMK